MERFPDGAHVRLRSRDQGGYLHADEDGRGVSLSLGLTSTGMAWRVDRVLHDGSTSVLLHSAAYCGRYLAASSDPAPPGHRVFLGYYDDTIQWKAIEAGNSGYVLLRHVSNRLLGAIDGRGNGVCIDVADDDQNSLMHWKVETFPTSPSARLPAPAAAMEQFRYGALVRLQSPVHGGYLHADEDGMAVSLCRRRESMNTAWKVHRILHHGSTRVRLQSAAHGRYLAASSDPAPPGHLGHRVVLLDCDCSADRILWEAVGSGDASGYVFLRHVSNRLLRTNGRYGGVSVAVPFNHQNAMMHWKVETIPAPAQAPPSEAMLEQFPDGAYVRLRSRVNGRYLHADEDGVYVDFLPHGGSLNVAWRVHRVLYGGTTRLLLQSAVSGRYLGLLRDHVRSAAVPTLVHSIYFNDLQQNDLRWFLQSVIHQGTNNFRLVNPESGLTIPPDGTPLVAELILSRSGLARLAVASVQWTVGRFQMAPGLPPLPRPTAEGFLRRIVLYILGDEYGNIDVTAAGAITFQGRSVLQLREELADSVGERFPERMAMCLWAGTLGRLIPLTSDLPSNNQTIEVILFESWTQAALGLRYPVLDEESSLVLATGSYAAAQLRHPNVDEP